MVPVTFDMGFFMIFMHDSSVIANLGRSRFTKLPTHALAFFLGASFWPLSIAFGGAGHGDHGSAKVSISVEGNKATVALEVSSEDAYGLEKEPNSPEEKQKAQMAVDKVTKDVSSMIVFDPTLSCTWQQKSIESWKTHEGDAKSAHGELHGEWDVNCKTKIEGSRLKFGMKKVFPAINSTEVVVAKGGKSSTSTIKRDRGAVSL